MMVNTDAMVSISEANQNFSRIARMVDEKGTVVITCKSADERVKSVCVVTVTSSAWEWFCNGFRKIG